MGLITRRLKYAGDVLSALQHKAEWDIDTACAFLEEIPDVNPIDTIHVAGGCCCRMNDVLKFPPTDNVSLPEAIGIVKSRLNEDDISYKSRILAIEKVANMETHNRITKDDLVKALRWIFEHYDF